MNRIESWVGKEVAEMAGKTHREKIDHLKKQIENLRDRLPAHSMKPQMFQQLEQLQEALKGLLEEGADRNPAD